MTLIIKQNECSQSVAVPCPPSLTCAVRRSHVEVLLLDVQQVVLLLLQVVVEGERRVARRARVTCKFNHKSTSAVYNFRGSTGWLAWPWKRFCQQFLICSCLWAATAQFDASKTLSTTTPYWQSSTESNLFRASVLFFLGI